MRRTLVKRQGQAFVITLWVLSILAVLAVSIGYRARIALRLGQYYRDTFRARCLSVAAAKYAIEAVLSDADKNVDTLKDAWVNNEEVFKNVAVNDRRNEKVDVGYFLTEGVMRYGVRDLESRLNINFCSEKTLAVLFEKCGVSGPAQAARNVLIWRGDFNDEDRDFDVLGYQAKKEQFARELEFVLVKDLEFEDYRKVKDLITVFGEGKININTAAEDLLMIFLQGVARESGQTETAALSLGNKIIALRQSKEFFMKEGDLQDGLQVTGDEEGGILASLLSKITYHSDNFLIEVHGNVGKIKSEIELVYDRKANKIVSWHES